MIRIFFMRRFRLFSLIMFIPMFLLLIIMGTYIYRVEHVKLMNEGKNMLSRVNDTWKYSIINTIDQQDDMMSSPQYRLSLKKVLRYSKIELKNSIFLNALKTLLGRYETANSYIHSIYLYLDGTDRIMTSSSEQLASLGAYYDRKWFTEYNDMKADVNEYISSRTLQHFRFEKAEEVMTIYQRMTYEKGVIVVNIKKKDFNDMIAALFSTPEQVLCIVNSDGDTVFISDSKLNKNNIVKEDILRPMIREYQKSGTYSKNQKFIKVDGKYYFVYMQESAQFPAYQVSLLPLSYFKKNIYEHFKGMIYFALFNVALIFLLAWLTTKRSFHYINECIRIFSAAEKGEIIDKTESDIKDEYTLLLNNIIFMYLKNNKMQVSLMEKQHQSEISEMVSLQLQINPHFIFNTLQTMDMEVLKTMGIQSTTHYMLQEFVSIIKYIFKNPMEKVTIDEELKYLKSYFEIQEIRFPNRCIVYYEIADKVYTYQIFRLMLQPMVENCFSHGLKGLDEHIIIKIKIELRDQRIKFTIIDNGCGMDPKELKAVYKTINDKGSKNIGLTNLNRRLTLNYGEESKLKIQSKKDHGTIISFSIPTENTQEEFFIAKEE